MLPMLRLTRSHQTPGRATLSVHNLAHPVGESSSAMRYHSDPDVGTVWTQDTSVVSVGDTRQFILRETHDHSRRHSFYLSSGDCVRMMGTCQRDYQHCVKASKDDVGPRISLVFKQSIAGQRRSISAR